MYAICGGVIFFCILLKSQHPSQTPQKSSSKTISLAASSLAASATLELMEHLSTAIKRNMAKVSVATIQSSEKRKSGEIRFFQWTRNLGPNWPVNALLCVESESVEGQSGKSWSVDDDPAIELCNLQRKKFFWARVWNATAAALSNDFNKKLGLWTLACVYSAKHLESTGDAKHTNSIPCNSELVDNRKSIWYWFSVQKWLMVQIFKSKCNIKRILERNVAAISFIIVNTLCWNNHIYSNFAHNIQIMSQKSL